MSADIIGMVTDAANAAGVDPSFALAIANAESGFNPNAVSSAGAQGVMQLMPKTATGLGVDPTNVEQNIQGGVKYLAQLGHQFNGDPALVAAAYNAGPGAVTAHGGVPPYPETQKYVAKVTGAPAPDSATPSLQSLYHSMGWTNGKPPAPAGAPASPAPDASGDDAPPDLNTLYKQMNFNPAAQPAAPSQPQGPIEQDANARASGVPDWARGAYNVANSVLLGAGPALSGAMVAGGKAVNNVATGQPIGQDVGETFKANMEAQQHALDTYGQAHPIANVAENIGGMVASGPAALGEHLVQQGAERLAPTLASKFVGKVATRAASAAAVGGVYGTNTGLAEGQDLPSALGTGAETAALSAPFGAAGEALPGAFAGLTNPVARKVIPAAIGAAGGYAAAPALGMNPMEGALFGGAAGYGAPDRLGPKSDGTPTVADHGQAMDLIAKAANPDTPLATRAPAAADTLDAAHPASTTAEALGAGGTDLVSKAAAVVPSAAEPVQDVMASRSGGTADRLAGDIKDATGIDADTAKLDAKAQTEAAQKQAAPLFDAALQGNGVMNPDLAAAAEHPLVKSALNTARRLVGPDSDVPNPDYATPDGTGQMNVSPEAYQAWVKSGSNDPADLMAQANAGVPKTIPTDTTWDMARRVLSYGVDRDAQGNPTYSPENHAMQGQAANLSPLLRDAIPGLGEALDSSGEYLKNRAAGDQGAAQFTGVGKQAFASSAQFDKYFDALSPGEQQANRQGYLGQLYGKIEKGNLVPDTYLNSSLHNGVMTKMFGAEAKGNIMAAIGREKQFQASAKTMAKVKGKTPEPAMTMGQGAMMGAISHHNPIAGAIKGAGEAAGFKGVKSVADRVQGKTITPGTANALAGLMAKSPQEVADLLRTHHRDRQAGVKLSDTYRGLGGRGSAITRGIGVGGAQTAIHALNGF